MKPTIAALLLTCLVSPAVAEGNKWLVYFGCYTNEKSGSKGIYAAPFNSNTGTLGEPALAAETASPSFLALHPGGKFLYSVGEAAAEGLKGGAVSAFLVDQPGMSLKLLNQVDSGGKGPCHISVDKTGTLVMIANYSGGSVASYRIQEDGTLSGAVSLIQHEGSSVNPQRQKGPHAHSINPSPDNRYALACDLGLDKVIVYQMNTSAGSLTASGSAELPPGSGPRHLAFHPSGSFVFVNNEMTMTVSTFSYAADTGLLTMVDTVSTLPPEDQGKPGFSTAETVAHPNGKFVYVSNRKHDTIAVFECDSATGRLKLIQNASAEGKTPRNICLDPSGRWMVVAHQDSNTAALLEVDSVTGKLSFAGRKIDIGGAVCVRFLAAD